MNRLESRLERLDALERVLALHMEGLTTGQLARMYGVDPSTIYRDISALERRGTGLIKHGRRWALDHRRALYSVKFSSFEVVALFIAARLLWRYSDERNPHAAKALAKLADAITARSSLVAQHVAATADAIGARPERPEYVEAFEALTRGWIERRKVWLVYRSAGSEASRTERSFCPYLIEPSGIGFSTYAIGLDDLRGAVRTLKLERIERARVTEDRFEMPEGDDLLRELESAWGIVWGEDTHEVRLRFSRRAARRVKESVWHPSQRIEDVADSGCLFTVRVGSLLEIRPWIRQWGADVEVLGPAALRAEIAAEARALMRVYGDGSNPEGAT